MGAHDNLFRKSFGTKVVTRDFLLSRLPADILARIDIDSLEKQNSSYISEKLKSLYTDVVYRVDLTTKETQRRGGDLPSAAYLYFLIEHQTDAEDLMPLRLLEYNVAMMRHHVEQGLKQLGKRRKRHVPKLPVIFNLVLYGGERYNYPKRLIDAFETPDLLYRILEQPFLVHLREDSRQRILQDGLAALVGLLLRESHRKDFADFVSKYPKVLDLIKQSSYAEPAIMYILDRDPKDVGKVVAQMNKLGPEIKGKVMTALEKVEQRGRKAGITEGRKAGITEGKKAGRQEGKIDIAKRMLTKGMGIKLIAEVTGLSLQSIGALNVL